MAIKDNYCVVCCICVTGPRLDIPESVLEQLQRVRGYDLNTNWISPIGRSDNNFSLRYAKKSNASDLEWDETLEWDVHDDVDGDDIPATSTWRMRDDEEDLPGFCIHSSCMLLLKDAMEKAGHHLDDLSPVLLTSWHNHLLFPRKCGPPYVDIFREACEQSFDLSIRNMWMIYPTWELIEDSLDDIEDADDIDKPMDEDELSTMFWDQGWGDYPGVARLIKRRWTQMTYAFLASTAPVMMNSVGSPIQPLLGPLPVDLLDTILQYIDAEDVRKLEMLSKGWFELRDMMWAKVCEKEGYACMPGAEMEEYRNTTKTWKAVYFCAESRNRRRVDKVIKWIVEQVGDSNRKNGELDDDVLTALEKVLEPVIDQEDRSVRVKTIIETIEGKVGRDLDWMETVLVTLRMQQSLVILFGSSFWFEVMD
ncbi:hypothetical protein BC829DRAFT_302426 [Chytridium lagenaria]|nr:hypothetical protein BC829DRAFT_302426 [Chytridium lagenaria]